MRHLRNSETGSASAELVLLAGLVLAFALTCIGFGRIALANMTVESAANAAARDASLARDAPSARENARSTANAALASSGIYCRTLTVNVDTSRMNATQGTVSVTINCTVELSDISVPGLPGSKLLTTTATSPVDPYRERR